jgi:hypothetical protein
MKSGNTETWNAAVRFDYGKEKTLKKKLKKGYTFRVVAESIPYFEGDRWILIFLEDVKTR